MVFNLKFWKFIGVKIVYPTINLTKEITRGCIYSRDRSASDDGPAGEFIKIQIQIISESVLFLSPSHRVTETELSNEGG